MASCRLLSSSRSSPPGKAACCSDPNKETLFPEAAQCFSRSPMPLKTQCKLSGCLGGVKSLSQCPCREGLFSDDRSSDSLSPGAQETVGIFLSVPLNFCEFVLHLEVENHDLKGADEEKCF